MDESDWKAFRRIVPEVRERYIQKRNAEIKALLEDSDLSHTETFWNVHEKVTKEADILQSCLDGHRRSRITAFIFEMLDAGLMDLGDLPVFSSELQDRAKFWYEGR